MKLIIPRLIDIGKIITIDKKQYKVIDYKIDSDKDREYILELVKWGALFAMKWRLMILNINSSISDAKNVNAWFGYGNQ